MRHLAVGIAVCSLTFAEAGNAQLTATFTPGGEPEPRTTTEGFLEPSFGLFVPLYVVDAANPGGLTTLFAVRNGSTDSVGVWVRYSASNRSANIDEFYTLSSRQTLTRNVRDVPGIPITDGTIKTGVVTITAVDPVTHAPIASNVNSGDYFHVDSAGNFASGDVLVDGTRDLCQHWDARYFAGGPFSGGTVFTFLTPNNPSDGLQHVVATGNVYTENGSFAGTAQVTSNRNVVQLHTSQFAGLPTFGTIEWSLTQGPGHVSVIMTASGRYSVEATAVCSDSLY